MEDIKTGEYYHVLGYIGYKNKNEVSVTFCNKSGVQTSIEFEPKEARKLLSPISEQPKYDPCRLLKKCDRVQVKRRNGRCNGKHGEYLREAFCIVAEDEIPNELVRVYHNSTEYRLDPAYLELITPIEELEPYEVTESTDYFAVSHRVTGDEPANFWKEWHPSPKEAAEAERDRLNAEYRKEQNNG